MIEYDCTMWPEAFRVVGGAAAFSAVVWALMWAIVKLDG